MRRIISYIAVLSVLMVLPVTQLDVGKLHPVQVVAIYKEKNWVVLETDTEDKGFGRTARQALQNLKDTSSGIVYLDTAEYLVITKNAEEEAEELRKELKHSVRLCMATKPVDLAETAEFLSAHGGLPKLKDWEKGSEIPVLSTFGDSLIFLKKVEKRA